MKSGLGRLGSRNLGLSVFFRVPVSAIRRRNFRNLPGLFSYSLLDRNNPLESGNSRDRRLLPFCYKMASSVSEAEKAVVAAKLQAELDAADQDPPTLFDKIVAGEIPCTKVYEDETCLAFRDIAPQEPTHVLVIPKKRSGLSRLTKATPDHKALLGHLMWAASEVARKEGLTEEGCRFVVNDGENGAQSVYHLHIHVLGGRSLAWPPG